MEEKNQLSRFIERYLDSKMEPSELRWFKKEMEGNIWLQEELELRRKANEYATNQDAIMFREKLIKAEANHRSKSIMQKVLKSKVAHYAAALAGIIIIGGILITRSVNIDPDRLMTEYANFSPSQTARSVNNITDEAYMKAIQFYNVRDFKNAVIWFEKIINDSGDNYMSEVDFRKGVSNMKIEKYENAISSFTRVIEHNDNLFIEDARWYLGWCYYNINEPDRAKTIFKAIASSDSRYKKPARKLARKL